MKPSFSFTHYHNEIKWTHFKSLKKEKQYIAEYVGKQQGHIQPKAGILCRYHK